VCNYDCSSICHVTKKIYLICLLFSYILITVRWSDSVSYFFVMITNFLSWLVESSVLAVEHSYLHTFVSTSAADHIQGCWQKLILSVSGWHWFQNTWIYQLWAFCLYIHSHALSLKHSGLLCHHSIADIHVFLFFLKMFDKNNLLKCRLRYRESNTSAFYIDALLKNKVNSHSHCLWCLLLKSHWLDLQLQTDYLHLCVKIMIM